MSCHESHRRKPKLTWHLEICGCFYSLIHSCGCTALHGWFDETTCRAGGAASWGLNGNAMTLSLLVRGRLSVSSQASK